MREELVAGSSGSVAAGMAAGSSLARASVSGPLAAEPGERTVGAAAFEVLGDMLCGLVEAAAVQDDFQVVTAALAVAGRIVCNTGKLAHVACGHPCCRIELASHNNGVQGGRMPCRCYPHLHGANKLALPPMRSLHAAAPGGRRRLISCLGTLPCSHCDWFWAGVWAFGVSRSYLEADEFLELAAVVASRLEELAPCLAGVGVPGAPCELSRAVMLCRLLGVGATDACCTVFVQLCAKI